MTKKYYSLLRRSLSVFLMLSMICSSIGMSSVAYAADGFIMLLPDVQLPDNKDIGWVYENGIYMNTVEEHQGEDIHYIDSNAVFDPATQKLTFSAEIKNTGTAGLTIGNKVAEQKKGTIVFFKNNGTLMSYGDGVKQFEMTSNTGWVANQWNELKLEVKGKNIKIYVNGLEKDSADKELDFSGSIGLFHALGANEFRNVKYKIEAISDSEHCQAVYDLITPDTIAPASVLYDGKLKGNLKLDAIAIPEGNGSEISWTSSNTNLISNTGEVTILSIENNNLQEDPNVTMTATITRGEATLTKDFNFVIYTKDETVYNDFSPNVELNPEGKDPEWSLNNGIYTITTESGYGDVFYVDDSVDFNPNTQKLTFFAEIKATEAAGLIVGSQGGYAEKNYLMLLRNNGDLKTMVIPWTGNDYVKQAGFDLSNWVELKVEVYQKQITLYVNGIEVLSYEKDYDFSGSIGLMHGFGTTQFRNAKYRLEGKSNLEYCQEVYDLINQDAIAPLLQFDNGMLRGNLQLDAISIPADNGSQVSWTSSNPNLISSTGVVTIISEGNGNLSESQNVTMTATITKGEATLTKTFDFIVYKEGSTIDFQDMTAFTPEGGTWVEENGVYKISTTGDAFYLDKTFQFNPEKNNLEFTTQLKTNGAAGFAIGSANTPSDKIYFIQIAADAKELRFGHLPYPGKFDKAVSNINWNNNDFQQCKVTVEKDEVTVYINDVKAGSIDWNADLSGYIGLFHVTGNSEFKNPQYRTMIGKTSQDYCQAVADTIIKDNIAPQSVLDSYGKVQADLTLQDTTTETGCKVTWSSSNTNIIANDGKVTIISPDNGNMDQDPNVTVTATITRYDTTITKQFDFQVLKLDPTNSSQQVYDLLSKDVIAPSTLFVRGMLKDNLKLDAIIIPEGNSSQLTWTSSNPNLISNTGVVTIIDENNKQDANVTVTATIKNGDVTLTKKLHFVVYDKTQMQNAEVKNLSEFTAEGGTWVEENGIYKISTSGDGFYLDKTYAFNPENDVLEFNAMVKTSGAAGLAVGSADKPTDKTYILQMAVSENAVRYIRLPYPNAFDKNIGGVTLNTDEFYNLKVRVIDKEVTVYINDKIIHSEEIDFDFSGYIGLFQNNGTSEFKNVQRLVIPKTSYYSNYYYCQTAAENVTEGLIAPRKVFDDYGRIRDDLDLQEITTDNGCTVTWSSSNTNIIDNSGKVTIINQSNGNINENPNVTIAASITKGDFTLKKYFEFTVQKFEGTDQERVDKDIESMTTGALIGEGEEATIHSIKLPEYGQQGSELTWSSSNTDVIANSGHVYRPKFDEGDKTVTLTLTATIGQITKTKDIQVKVKADEEYTDPMRTSDEDFFGVYSNGSWTNNGALDYTKEELKDIKAAVQSGDYALAKQKLLEYMRSIDLSKHYYGESARDSAWASSQIAGLHTLQGNNYFGGGAGKSTNTSDEFQPVEVDLYTRIINKGGKSTVSIEGKYNETSKLVVASRESGQALAPKIELIVNGEKKVYTAEADTIVSSNNSSANYGLDKEMEVYLFGKTLNADNNKAKIRFSFDDLFYSDDITSAKLIINCKVTPAFAGEKEFIIIKEPSNTWDEKSASWKSFGGYLFNFNGIENGNHWGDIGGSDAEYKWQVPRFLLWDMIAEEYAATKDEDYAYYAIQTMLDFLKDKGDLYPRSLDVAERLKFWTMSLDEIITSKYMTPDAITAITKSIYQIFKYLPTTTTAINWKHNELDRMYRGVYTYPLFADQDNWIDICISELDKIACDNLLENGSYIESTGGYNWAAYILFTQFKEIAFENGRQPSAKFDELLEKGAYYALLLRYPNAVALQWGDEGAYQIENVEQFPKFVDWYNNYEIQYIDSFGKKGVKPNWTSRKFEDSKSIMLRSDWTTDSLYSFSQVRGGGHHSHLDDNIMNAYAYGSVLLTDAGIFTYTGSDPLRQWGVSTKAHNTVEINGYSQDNRNRDNPPKGTIDNWAENPAFTFASLTSKSYKNYYHQRNTTLNKAGFWIVSDYMTPYGSKETAPSLYKQIWHMRPNAKMSIDENNNVIQSNFTKGANIILANADRKDAVTTSMADGYYDYNYQVVTDSKYAYFEASDKVGKTSIDTFIFPYREGQEATATSERISLDVDPNVATAMKFSYTVDGEKTNGYYLLDYNYNLATERDLGSYSSNAKLFMALENEEGNVKQVMVAEGSQVKDNQDNVLLTSKEKLNDYSYTIEGSTLNIETTHAIDFLVNNVSMYIPQNITGVTLNENEIPFNHVDNTITLQQPVTYSVTFEENGGTTVSDITNITSGSLISIPATPTKAGYSFDGWYKDTGMVNSWNFSTDTVTTNITLYAKWSYIVTPVYNTDDKPTESTSKKPNKVIKNKDGSVGIIASNLDVDSRTKEAKVALTSKELEDAFGKAKDNQGIKQIQLEISRPKGAEGYQLQLPKKELESDEKKKLEIKSDIGTVTLPGNMFDNEASNQSNNIQLSFKEVDKEKDTTYKQLDEKTKTQIGNKKVIEISRLENGKIKPWENNNAPVSITIPYTPTDEEKKNPENIIIWYIDAEGNATTVPNGRYNAETGRVEFEVTHFSVYAIGYNSVTFDDLDAYPWAKHQVEIMAAKGIANEAENKEYAPGDSITRADFLTALMRTLELRADFDNNFENIQKDSYYYEAIGIAKELGIVSADENNHFDPLTVITREEMMVLVGKALKIKGFIQVDSEQSILDDYRDKSQITITAMDSVASLVHNKIILGSNNKLHPKDPATKAEAAVVLYRIYNMK